MKKLLLSAIVLTGSFLSTYAQQLITVQGEITSNQHWTANNQYLLKGEVYVTNGNSVTIDPGTIIRGYEGDNVPTKPGSLIIERGAKIIAQGTAKAPIVFTSNKSKGNRNYGDWGGLIICGKAPVNTPSGEAQIEGGVRSLYGGTDAADSSGVVSFVRIEFAGIAFAPNNEINGLTLGAIGNKTKIDHIQVSYSNDDAIEWFGGTVNAKYLFSWKTLDDDFDCDQSFGGNVQFAVVQRDPYVADAVSGSNGFEVDSYKANVTIDGLTTQKLTKPVFSNVTMVGPVTSTSAVEGTDYDKNYIAALNIRKGGSLNLFNSLVMGYVAGIVINESPSTLGSTVLNIKNGDLEIENVTVAGILPSTTPSKRELVYVINKSGDLTPTNTSTEGTDTTTVNSVTNAIPFSPDAGPYSWFAAGNGKIFSSATSVGLGDPFNETNADFIPKTTSPVTTGTLAASFTNSKVNNNFFTKTSYVGAFANTGQESDDWTLDWVETDPDNRTYSIGESTRSLTRISSNTTNLLNPTPASSMIASVYPNPTAGSMRISYNLEKAADVTIAIFDLSGNKVSDVYNGFAGNGENSVNFEGSSLTKGLYLIKIVTNDTVKTIKVTVN